MLLAGNSYVLLMYYTVALLTQRNNKTKGNIRRLCFGAIGSISRFCYSERNEEATFTRERTVCKGVC